MDTIDCKYVGRMFPAAGNAVGFVLERMDGQAQFRVCLTSDDAKKLHVGLYELLQASGQPDE